MLFRSTRASQHRSYSRPSVESLESRLAPHAGHMHSSLNLPLLDGEVHADAPPPIFAEAGRPASRSSTSGPVGGDLPSLVVPSYSSLPGAPATLYLDFNGHFDSTWGSYANVDTPPYDTDGNATAFSSTELSNIQKIWQYVAEDFAPFNINVTTVLPASFANGVALRVAIGGNGAWAGGTYGGIAYIDAFTNSIVNTVYVFPTNLGNGNPRYVADASSHEAGHGFGLQHQSSWSGTTKTSEYQSGPGDGTAPTMGSSYSATRSLWWYGLTTSSTTYQNDLTVIGKAANGFGLRTDDHGNDSGTASSLTVSGTGAVSGTGLIGTASDVDVFAFTTGAGTITLTADVPDPYNNLDARLELRDANGTVVASASPTTSFDATLTYTAAAGTYFLFVSNAGLSTNATATNYGFNVGQYSLTGSVLPTNSNLPAAPSNLTATAASTSQINLSWTDNAGNEDGFRIERLVGGTWTEVGVVGANVTSWQDTGLAANTQYSYRVRAYNASGNSSYSNNASATTPSAPAAPAGPTNLTGSAKSKPSLRVNLTWFDNATNETGYRVLRSTDSGATWSQVGQLGANATSFSDTAVAKGATYQYKVYAYNGVGNSPFSNTITVTIGNGGGARGLSVSGELPTAGDPFGPYVASLVTASDLLRPSSSASPLPVAPSSSATPTPTATASAPGAPAPSTWQSAFLSFGADEPSEETTPAIDADGDVSVEWWA